MADADSASELNSVRAMAAAWGIDLDDDRALRLVEALARYRAQMANLDRLDLKAHEPGVANPADGR